MVRLSRPIYIGSLAVVPVVLLTVGTVRSLRDGAPQQAANPTDNPVHLQYEKIAPPMELSDGDEHLITPVAIEMIGETVYVADQRRHAILMFDSSGASRGSFGSQGWGPGEFDALLSLRKTPDDRHLVALTNNRVIIFDPEGNYMSEFRNMLGYTVETTDEYIVLCSAGGPARGSITLFTYDGEVVKNFSYPTESIIGNSAYRWLFSPSRAAIENGRVWEAYVHYNMLRVSSLDGNLINEYELEDVHLRNMHHLNQRLSGGNERVSESNRSIRTPLNMTYGLRIYLDRLWLLSSPEKYIRDTDREYRVRRYVFEISLNGEIVRTYLQLPMGARDIIVLNRKPFRAIFLSGGPRIYWARESEVSK